MVTTTPLGAISLAQDYLRKTLADCATWRTWVGAIDQAQSLNRVHLVGIAPPSGDIYTRSELERKRPFAIVAMSPEGGFSARHIAGGGVREYGQSGAISIQIVDDVQREIAENFAEIDIRFNNNVGQIIDEMKVLSGQAGYLAIDTLEVESGPFRSHEDEESGVGDLIAIDLRVTWDDGGA